MKVTKFFYCQQMYSQTFVRGSKFSKEQRQPKGNLKQKLRKMDERVKLLKNINRNGSLEAGEMAHDSGCLLLCRGSQACSQYHVWCLTTATAPQDPTPPPGLFTHLCPRGIYQLQAHT